MIAHLIIMAAIGPGTSAEKIGGSAGLEVINKPPRPSINMVINRGLTKDIHLKCKSHDGALASAMMTFSVTTENYCTPKGRCHKNATTAAVETCR